MSSLDSKKIRTPHHVLKEFHRYLLEVAKMDQIKTLIPGRIDRQQKGSSDLRLHFSYFTDAGMKWKMIKGSTAQELFVVCPRERGEQVREEMEKIWKDLSGRDNRK